MGSLSTTDQHGDTIKRTILIVDDEEQIRNMLTQFLAHDGYEIITCADLASTRAIIADEQRRIDLVLLDMHLPDGDGIDLLPEIHCQRPSVPVIMASGMSGTVSADDLLAKGVDRVLNKPFDLCELEDHLSALLPAQP